MEEVVSNPLEEISANIMEDMSSLVKTELASDNEHEFEDFSENIQEDRTGEDHFEVYGSPIEVPEDAFRNANEESRYESAYIPEVNYTKNYYTDVSPEVARSRRKAREENSEPRLYCPVCADKVNGIHYGIFSCEGCKNFFKRSVTTNKFYTCFSSGNCDVKITVDDFGVKQTRKGSRCQACRLQACLNSGMVYLGYGYNRSSRKVRRSAFQTMKEQQSQQSPVSTPTKKQRLNNTTARSLMDALLQQNPSVTSASLDPLSTAQPTDAVRITADSVSSASNCSPLSHHQSSNTKSSPSSVASRSRDEAYHAHAQNRGILSRGGGDSGSILASMLKAPLKESGGSSGSNNSNKTKNNEAKDSSNSCSPSSHDSIALAFSGMVDGREVSGGSADDLGHLTKEQSDVVIAMLREQLKYEREKNKELKNRVDFKNVQVESLEKQVLSSEKHSELTNKIINKQKMEIERMKLEINRIGLFRNLLSKNVPNGAATSEVAAEETSAEMDADPHHDLDHVQVNGHASPQHFPFIVKDEPLE